MAYRFVAPVDFFESPRFPAICLFSGRTDALRPVDLDLSFVRARPPAATFHGQPVTDLITDSDLYQALSGHTRRTSRNLLLTFPADPAAFFRWRLHTRLVPLLLTLAVPILAMSSAFYWVTWSKMLWVASAVLAGLATGVALAALYRRRQTAAPEFTVTPHGYVAVTLPAAREADARAFHAALQSFLDGLPKKDPPLLPPNRTAETVSDVVLGATLLTAEATAEAILDARQ